MTEKEIQHLAELARIDLSPEDARSLSKEFDEILSYVDQVKEVAAAASTEPSTGPHYNVLRDDGEPHESGIYTEALLDAAPSREGPYLKVKKILDNE